MPMASLGPRSAATGRQVSSKEEAKLCGRECAKVSECFTGCSARPEGLGEGVSCLLEIARTSRRWGS